MKVFHFTYELLKVGQFWRMISFEGSLTRIPRAIKATIFFKRCKNGLIQDLKSLLTKVFCWVGILFLVVWLQGFAVSDQFTISLHLLFSCSPEDEPHGSSGTFLRRLLFIAPRNTSTLCLSAVKCPNNYRRIAAKLWRRRSVSLWRSRSPGRGGVSSAHAAPPSTATMTLLQILRDNAPIGLSRTSCLLQIQGMLATLAIS